MSIPLTMEEIVETAVRKAVADILRAIGKHSAPVARAAPLFVPPAAPAAKWPADKEQLDQFKWTTRVRNVFETMGLKTVGEVRALSENRLMCYSNFGKVSLVEVERVLGPLNSFRREFRLPDGMSLLDRHFLWGPVWTTLAGYGFETVGDLRRMTGREISELDGVGETSLRGIIEAIGPLAG